MNFTHNDLRFCDAFIGNSFYLAFHTIKHSHLFESINSLLCVKGYIHLFICTNYFLPRSLCDLYILIIVPKPVHQMKNI